MAWTAPRTWVAGETVTAVLLNTHVRDNLIAINSIPAAHVTHSAAQSIANVTFVALAFDTERYDTDAIHDTVTNNTRLTCKTAGKYEIGGGFEFNGAPTDGIAEIRLNGSVSAIARNRATFPGAGVPSVKTIYQLAINDYVELLAYQNTGAASNVNKAANYSPEFWMHRLSD